MNQEIYTNIIQPIDLYLEGKASEKDVSWYDISYEARRIRKSDKSMFYELREALKPYYKRLIMADDSFFLNRNTDTKAKSYFIMLMEGEGKYFCREYNDIDIIQCAENWGKQLMVDNHQPTVFFMILRTLIEHGYTPNWNMIYENTKVKLAKAKSYGNFKTHELLCVLMGVTMIQRTTLANEHKKAYLNQMHNQWEFLRYMYSVMIHYIVGLKSDNFAAVAATMNNRKSSYPYMHLFYKAFKDNFDYLCPDGLYDQRTGILIKDLAEKHLHNMEEVIKHTNPSDDLTSLCEILFPKRMKEVLEQERPKTYEELEKDIDRLTNSYDEMVKRLAETVKPSVTIDELNAAFDRFQSVDLAMAFFNSINSLLIQNPTWLKYAPEIQQNILSRQATSNVIIQNQYGPVNGNVQSQSLQIPQLPFQPPKQIEQK